MSSTGDGFAKTANALSATLAAHGELLSSNVGQFSNYLLDACGSDHRPLVELLLSVGPTVRARLSSQEPRAAWEARRAPLVHQLVATRYLQPDVARWLVDAWGAALGIAPSVVAQPALAQVEQGGPTAAVSPTGGHGTVNVPPPPLARAAAPRAPLAPPSRPSRSARATIGAMIGTAHTKSTSGATARPIAPRWRTLSPAMNRTQLLQLQRMERVSLGLIGLAAVAVFVAAVFALRGRKGETVAQAAVLPVIAAGSAADSASRAAVGPMHPLPATMPRAAGASESSAVAGLPANASSVRTNDVGRDTLFHVQAARLLPEATHTVSGAQLISAGLGGRYRVEQHVRSVDGSVSCADVAAALANGRTSIEVIAHVPGTFAFAMTSRGVSGVIDADGYFDAGPRSGTTDGVTWQFRMRGQFTATGFVGESQTSTEATIKWGRTQSCMTVADLVAERIAP